MKLSSSFWLSIACLPSLSLADSGGDAPNYEYFTPANDCICSAINYCQPASDCSCRIEDNRQDTCSCEGTSIRTDCNDPTDCCAGRGARGRKLMGAELVFDPDNAAHQDLYKNYLEACGEHPYEVWLMVTSHLYVVLSPKGDVDSDCPFLVTHAHFKSRDSEAKKMLLFWSDKEEGNAELHNGAWRDKSYAVGTFPLLDMAQAYEEVDPSSEGPYNVVSNNCGHYILSLAHSIGLKIDAQMTSFVTRRLVEESGSKLAASLRDSRIGTYWSAFWEWVRGIFGCMLGHDQKETNEAIWIQQQVDHQVALRV